MKFPCALMLRSEIMSSRSTGRYCVVSDSDFFLIFKQRLYTYMATF